MSTITKLDKNVRLDRYLRKQIRRDLAGDAATAALLVNKGIATTKHPDYAHYTNAARFKHEQLVREMTVRTAILRLTSKHISQICRDPSRSGARKEAILAKLGVQAA